MYNKSLLFVCLLNDCLIALDLQSKVDIWGENTVSAMAVLLCFLPQLCSIDRTLILHVPVRASVSPRDCKLQEDGNTFQSLVQTWHKEMFIAYLHNISSKSHYFGIYTWLFFSLCTGLGFVKFSCAIWNCLYPSLLRILHTFGLFPTFWPFFYSPFTVNVLLTVSLELLDFFLHNVGNIFHQFVC